METGATPVTATVQGTKAPTAPRGSPAAHRIRARTERCARTPTPREATNATAARGWATGETTASSIRVRGVGAPRELHALYALGCRARIAQTARAVTSATTTMVSPTALRCAKRTFRASRTRIASARTANRIVWRVVSPCDLEIETVPKTRTTPAPSPAGCAAYPRRDTPPASTGPTGRSGSPGWRPT